MAAERRRELSLPAVDDDEVRHAREALVGVAGPEAREPARDRLAHRADVVLSVEAADRERAVVRVLRTAVDEDGHRGDDRLALDVRDVEALDRARGRLSRFSTSRSSSRAAIRFDLAASRTAVSASSASCAFSAASSTSRRFSPRSGVRTTTREPRRSPRNSASGSTSSISGGTSTSGGTLGDAAVVLEDERLEDRLRVLARDVLEVEAVAVDHLPVAQREDLDGSLVAVDREPDDVHRPDVAPVGRLPVGEVSDREEAVSIARRLLEALVRRGLAHPLGRAPPGSVCVSPERNPIDAVDDLGVAVRRDRSDARREAAVDVEVEARDARVPTGPRPLARPKPKDAVQDVERLTHLLRVRVRAEVDRPAAVPLAREHHARVLVRERDGDVRERLVVAEPDVERRTMPLDEVLLQVERLRLGPRDDHLDVGDALGELGRARSVRRRAGSSCGRASAATSPCRRTGRLRPRRGTDRRRSFAGSVRSFPSRFARIPG